MSESVYSPCGVFTEENGRYQQMDPSYAGEPDAVRLYRRAGAEEALRVAGAAGLLPDPDVVGATEVHDCPTCAYRDTPGAKGPCKSCTVLWKPENGGCDDNWMPAGVGLPAAPQPLDTRSVIEHGYANFEYAQGTKECIAFNRGVKFAEAAHGFGVAAPSGDMRAEFQAWVKDRGCDTDGAWSAWQACWNLLRTSGVSGSVGKTFSPSGTAGLPE